MSHAIKRDIKICMAPCFHYEIKQDGEKIPNYVVWCFLILANISAHTCRFIGNSQEIS